MIDYYERKYFYGYMAKMSFYDDILVLQRCFFSVFTLFDVKK